MRVVYSLKYKLGIFLASVVRFIIPKRTDSQICHQENKDYIFLITSTIDPTTRPHGYHTNQKRSDFDTSSRFLQTLETIRSIGEKVPDATTYLLENSNVSDEYRTQLELECTKVLYFSNDPIARLFRDSRNKGSGEAYMLSRALKGIQIPKDSVIIKISGRYRLSEKFDLAKVSAHKCTFLKTDGVASTRLYFVPGAMWRLYLRQLRSSLIATILGVSLEDVIWRGLAPTTIAYVQKIGVTGLIGVDSRVTIDE